MRIREKKTQSGMYMLANMIAIVQIGLGLAVCSWEVEYVRQVGTRLHGCVTNCMCFP